MVVLKFVFGIEYLWVYVLVIIVSVFINIFHRRKLNAFTKPKTVAEFDKLIDSDPDDAQSYFLRAQAYLTKFRTEENSNDKAKKDLNTAIKLAPGHFQSYEARGFLQLSNNNFNKAISDFSKAIELNPESSHAYYSRAVAYTQISNYKLAQKDYEKVIEINPTHAEAFRNKGNVLFKLKRYKQAISDWEQAITLKPELQNELLPLIKGTEKKLN